MKPLKSIFLKISALLIVVWISSCNYTQTYMPALNDQQHVVLDSINSKYSFEDVSLAGKKTSGSGGTHTTLTVRFINGKNIPADDDKMSEAAKQLALQIKKVLKNPNEFESYTILFVTRTVDGAETTEKSIGHEFKASEL